MSVEDPIELARAFMGAASAAMAGEEGSRERVRALLHPEIVSVTPAAEMQGGRVVGAEAGMQLLEELIDTWESWEMETSNFEEVNGRAVLDAVSRGRSRIGGVPYTSPHPRSNVLEFRDGLLYRWYVLPSRSEALELAEREEIPG